MNHGTMICVVVPVCRFEKLKFRRPEMDTRVPHVLCKVPKLNVGHFKGENSGKWWHFYKCLINVLLFVYIHGRGWVEVLIWGRLRTTHKPHMESTLQI